MSVMAGHRLRRKIHNIVINIHNNICAHNNNLYDIILLSIAFRQNVIVGKYKNNSIDHLTIW